MQIYYIKTGEVIQREKLECSYNANFDDYHHIPSMNFKEQIYDFLKSEAKNSPEYKISIDHVLSSKAKQKSTNFLIATVW
mgnify:CR=1 FL=1